jgi:hypothetical protein
MKYEKYKAYFIFSICEVCKKPIKKAPVLKLMLNGYGRFSIVAMIFRFIVLYEKTPYQSGMP